MKKKLLTICWLCLLAVTVVSCTHGGENGNNELTTDNNGNNEITQTEKADNPIVTDNPSNSEKPVTPDDSSKTVVEKEDKSVASLRKSIKDAKAHMGVAYLGYTEGAFDEVKSYIGELGLAEEFEFVGNIKETEFFGKEYGELYLVVPADKDTSVKVYEAVPDFEAFEINKGDLLGESNNGRPFLVRGESSEVVSSLVLVTDSMEYCPLLSGMDGMLVAEEGVYDFSPYTEIKEYFGIQPEISDGADPIFCGSWFGEAENGNYELMAMSLSLYVDGSAEYLYGYGNSEPVEYFTGEWSYDSERDMILLDLNGGAMDADFNVTEPYDLECGFKWDMDYRDESTYLILVHEDGDPILFGKNGATFEFVNILEPDGYSEDYSYLHATWAKISERVETYLELFPDGSARFTHKDIYGNEVDCRGIWTADGLTLFLDLYDTEDDTKLLYSGEFGIMYENETLTLSHFDGDFLTDFMKEQGYDSFVRYAVG